jgi:hypothetical protein
MKSHIPQSRKHPKLRTPSRQLEGERRVDKEEARGEDGRWFC